MTKQHRTISISAELDAAIGSLAMKHKMSYSELVEKRLYENGEIFDEISRLRKLPADPVVVFDTPPVKRHRLVHFPKKVLEGMKKDNDEIEA